MIGQAAAGAADPWWIIGSAAVVVHGGAVPHVKDVDLMMSGGDAKCLCAGWAASSAGPMQVTASGPGFSASGRNRRFPWNFWRFQPPHRRRVARAVDVHAGTGDQRGQPRFRAFGGRAGAGTPLIRQAQRPRTRKIANSVVSAFMGSGSDGGWLSGRRPRSKIVIT